jgi:phosphoglycolate phosphatase-like HAD superfamily hydrolase
MPHAGELFESIRARGSQVYLNTGFNGAIADVIVQNLNLGNVLNGYIGSDEVMASRPQPDMIRLTMGHWLLSANSRRAL